ncbi:MAG: kinase [Rhodobacteraceae bacterium]|nr:MAG: kinase [Paracoccaceae bacterium]
MEPTPEILCMGAAHWDVIGRSTLAVAPGDDVPGRVRESPGGVALNIARGLAQTGCATALLAAIGADPAGDALSDLLARDGVQTRHLHRPAHLPTDRYLAIEDTQGLIAAIADSTTLEQTGAAILAPLLTGALKDWRGTVVLDCGLPAQALARLRDAALSRLTLRLASASPAKVARLRLFLGTSAVFYLNRAEASALLAQDFPDSRSAAMALVAAGAARALVTDGARPATDADGVALISSSPPPVTATRITGAGDAFIAAHIAAEHRAAPRDAALAAALAQAARHISSP